MKKVIALVLAVALSLSMASVVFAAGATSLSDYSSKTNFTPGSTLYFSASDFSTVDTSTTSELKSEYMDAEYFSIKVEYSRGKDLVKEVKFDESKVAIVLKDSAEGLPTVPNFQIKSITLTGKKNGVSEKYQNKKFVINGNNTSKGDVTGAKYIGYDLAEVVIKDEFDVAYDTIKDKMVKFITGDYGIATIDFDGLASAEVRVYKNEKFFLTVDTKADLDIVKANPDADIEFLTFKGTPSFSSNAKVEIYADEDKYLYELKDGKLVESNFKYDEDAGAFVGKARTLGKYVISDMKLVAAATAEETKNPDTGANDVVGVAVALAVVSLVAAGAVSLKK